MSFDFRNKYLLAADIMDWNRYNDDGTVKYYSKYLSKDGKITWIDQVTKQAVFFD